MVALFSFHNLCLGNQVIFKNFVNTCPIQNFMYVFTALKKLLKYNYPLDPIISKAPYNYSKQFHPYWNCNSIAVSLNHCWLEAHGTLHITMYWWILNICVCNPESITCYPLLNFAELGVILCVVGYWLCIHPYWAIFGYHSPSGIMLLAA